MGVRAAGAARRSPPRRHFQHAPESGRGRSTCSTAGSRLYERIAIDGDTRATRSRQLYSDDQRRSSRPATADVRRPDGGQRGARGHARHRVDAAADRRRSTRTTPTRRLAVSTPQYSTAILADNRGKRPLRRRRAARLYDADGGPIGGTGGHPPAASACASRPQGPAHLMRASGPLTRPARPPLTLTRSPRGRATRQRSWPPVRRGPFPDAGSASPARRPARHLGDQRPTAFHDARSAPLDHPPAVANRPARANGNVPQLGSGRARGVLRGGAGPRAATA